MSALARRSFLAVAALSLMACATVHRPDGGSGLLAVGAVAPDVVGHNAEGIAVRLSDKRGFPAVVYFYPKDGTPGCTTQACAFRDNFKEYERRQVTIFGVSGDTEESHREFQKSHKFTFPLVSDVDGKIAQAYGVSSTLGMSARVTFLVDPAGNVRRVWPQADPALNVQEILQVLDKP